MKAILTKIFTILLAFCLTSCTKEFLDAKPSTDLVVPRTLTDLIGLLDNTSNINGTGGLGQMGADEYVFLDYMGWQSTFYAMERNSYIWAQDVYEGLTSIGAWDAPYRSIYYANNALESLDNMNLPDSPEQDQVKGWALFIRAYAYHDLVRNFCLAYDPQTADTDLGLPIRVDPRVDEIQQRASLKETYKHIIIDLNQAASLLTSVFQQNNRNRPSKSAAYALLARLYIMMNDYENAELNTDRSLALYNRLIDYNTVSTTDLTPFQRDNDETIFAAEEFRQSSITATAEFNNAVTVNPEIISSYHEHDLRPSIFFAKNVLGNYYVKRGYSGSGNPFHGLAVDELYLIKAECLARRGQSAQAMEWVNKLLINRFDKTKPYVPLTANSPAEAIDIILQERKKQLIWRGIRWSDIKRLNKIGASITLKRELNGQEYILPPNDLRYAFPIPDDEIERSKIEQNPR